MELVYRVLESPELHAALIAGLTAAVVGWLLARYRPDWGLLWFVSVLLAARFMNRVDLADAEQAFTQRAWVLPLAVVALLAGSYGLYANRLRPEVVVALFVSLGGVWATVPDTEESLLLLGATLPLLWLAWPQARTTVGFGGSIVVVATALWGAGLGAIGREGAYVGAFGAIASLALFTKPSGHKARWVDLGAHAALVFGWSRVAGLSRSPITALAIGVAITVVLLVIKSAVAAQMSQT